MAFYCYGLKDICKCDILCMDCKFYDHSGGMEVKTNADRIRAMSDEEFVKFVGHNCLCDRIQDYHREWCNRQAVCENCLEEWLKQPVKED